MADNNNNIIFTHKDIAILKLLADSGLYSDKIKTPILALLTFYQLQNVPATFNVLGRKILVFQQMLKLIL